MAFKKKVDLCSSLLQIHGHKRFLGTKLHLYGSDLVDHWKNNFGYSFVAFGQVGKVRRKGSTLMIEKKKRKKMQVPKFFFFKVSMLIIGLTSVCKCEDCRKPPKTITVSQSGNANFKTVQSAIDSVPSGNSQWVHIQISPGVYREKVVIERDKLCIYLKGGGGGSTSIEWNDHGNAHFTATFNIKASNIVANAIAFKNTYNTVDTGKVVQAVAARVHEDKIAFYDCEFIGVQDTLFDSYGRHYYKGCYIQGGVDFIFGSGQSMFEGSTLFFSMGLGPKVDGVFTANEREEDDNSGYVFKNCNITGTGGKAILGRSLNAYGRVIVANSLLSDVVRPEGWESLHHNV
ncbi:putative pectinesterase 10 [Arachis stenosperma]|uniref:putative pectinesterase 10 n=1 Tax=Arachis stenosperma TaxID=217475 RepID=UPI0025AC056B|nr:putative pectinesterase 10 [Arachis stenosperma]